MILTRATAALVLSAGLAAAQDDLSAFHPLPRPDFTAEAMAPAETIPHPLPRPADLAAVAKAALDFPAIRPPPRPDFATAMMPQEPVVQLTAMPKPQVPPGPEAKGMLCQNPALKGKALLPINSKVAGCDVPDAVLVSQINGVTLTPAATINCEEAAALSRWITKGLQPIYNGRIVALNVADSYACRPRNNVRGNKVSVHGLGQAIDIASFVTSSGQTLSVTHNYDAKMKAASKAGCGTFHTILGPGSDGFHENHIHFDVAHHGGRDYCR